MDEVVVWTVPNPIGFLDDHFWDNQFGPVWGILLLGLTVGCVAAMVQRFRKAGSVEREQMKWLMLAVGFFGVVYGTLAVINGDQPLGWIDVLFALSLASIPVAIAIALCSATGSTTSTACSPAPSPTPWSSACSPPFSSGPSACSPRCSPPRAMSPSPPRPSQCSPYSTRYGKGSRTQSTAASTAPDTTHE